MTYRNFFVFDYWLRHDEENFKNKSKKLDSIFSIIIFISMGLCFFSLTSSMTANIYDQAKEISLMRSCGMTKNYIKRIYIYEALTLVLSCSLCGFLIGVSIGNLMILQQSMLQSISYIPAVPLKQLKTMVQGSVVLAVLSTLGTASRILAMSIPDI